MERHCRTKNMTEIEKEIEIKINQYAMLSNTIQEVLRKEYVPKESVDTLQKEADKTLMEINALRKKAVEEKENTSNLFDSIKKVENNSPYDIKKYSITLENVMSSNRFLVRMSGFNIPEFMISSVDFCDADENKLHLKIYDFVATDDDGKSVPVASLLKNEKTFTIYIDYLDATGRIVYREEYIGCTISSLIKSSLDSTIDEFHTMLVEVHFKDVEYETT